MLAAALELGPRNSLRPHTYHALLGLLASTGLRVGEAIRLTVADVQLAFRPPHLIIRQTKFAKSRLVPLHATAAEQLRRYTTQRQRLGYDALSDAWLISEQGGPLRYSNLQIWFARFLRRLDIRSTEGNRNPSLHSFRHGFVVERLRAWQEAGANVQALVPLGRLSRPPFTARDLLLSECHTRTVERRGTFVCNICQSKGAQ